MALCTLAILLSLAYAGCEERSSTLPASADNAPTQPSTESTATPLSDAAPASAKGKTDPCKLLTAEEIKSIQGHTLKEIKGSEQASRPFTTTQCSYATNNFVNSVSLTVTQKNPTSPCGESIREFWEERFGREERHEKDRERRDKDRKGGEEEEGEKEESLPPQPVKSLGDDAYSVGNAKIGALYVLKGDKLLRISIGGAHTQPVRTEKMKALAQTAIKRL